MKEIKEIRNVHKPSAALEVCLSIPFVVPGNDFKFACDAEVMTKHYFLMEVRFAWSHYVHRRFRMKHCIKNIIFWVGLLNSLKFLSGGIIVTVSGGRTRIPIESRDI